MTTAPFNVEIQKKIEQALETLLASPEVKAVAFVIDWNLPPQMTSELPLGGYKAKSNESLYDKYMSVHRLVERLMRFERSMLGQSAEIAISALKPPTPPEDKPSA